MARIMLEKEARRSQLTDAAIQVFAQKGYHRASITDIIEVAGVARGTFYLYFDSKLDAFHAVMDRYLEMFREVVKREARRPYDDPSSIRAELRASLLEWLRFYRDHRDLAKIVFREGMAIEPDFETKYLEILESCFSHWRESIERFQKIGFVRKDLDPEFINLTFTGLLMNVVLRVIIPQENPDLEGLVGQWVEFIESGIKEKGWQG